MNVRPSTTPSGASAIGLFAKAFVNGTAARVRGDASRSGAPVWRNSYYVGQIEDRIWKPINGGTRHGGKRWTAALLKGAKKFERTTREQRRETEPGARNGALGDVGLAVLEYLYETVDYATGRLEPALRTIANEIGHSYSAVHRAITRLREHGFLAWMRRSEPVEDPAPGEPTVKQVSNAYALLCPPAMRSWLSRLLGGAPTPECEADRRKRERAEFDAMLAGLTAQERLAATWTGGALLGDTLKDLAALVDRRESQSRESSKSDEIGGSF